MGIKLFHPGSWSLNSIADSAVDVLLAPYTAGVSLGAGEAWKWLMHRIPDMRRDREAQIQSATNARNIIYGRTRVGNQIAYAESTGSKNQTLHILCLFAGHEVDGYEEIYFDDKLVCNSSGTAPVGWSGAWVAGAWAIQAPYVGKVVIELFDGSQIAACASMVAASAGGWTDDHKLLGIAYGHITLTYSEGVFPAGLPTVKAVILGKKVFDPRDGTIKWSDNPALCKLDFMTMPTDLGGMGMEYSNPLSPYYKGGASA